MKKTLLFLLPLALLASCHDREPDIPEETVEAYSVSHEMIVLGEKLEDPYSVSNMTKALQSLYGTKAPRETLQATDVYVRFLPSCDADFETLRRKGVDLTDHPLDYRIVVDGDYYHDPQLPQGSITWQYAVVKPDFAFPQGIRYEILDDCYIPDTEMLTRSVGGVDWEAVERESFRLTGNADMLEGQTRSDSRLKPSGDILIVDPLYNGGDAIGVAGVKVVANRFVKFASAYTDAEGHYEIGKSFSSSPRYRLVFQNRKGFGIGLNLLLVQGSVSTLGKNPSSGVSVTIDGSSDRKLFTRCVVNNAAWDWYERCSSEDDPVRTPPSNLRLWLFRNLSSSAAPMLQQGVLVDGGIVKKYLGEYTDILKMFLPDIALGLKGSESYQQVYEEAVRELAHASLFMRVGKDWWEGYAENILKAFVSSGFRNFGTGSETGSGYCELSEMWSYYMDNVVMRERYGMDFPTAGTSFWFYPQIFLYMDDRGLGAGKIYSAYGEDVPNLNALKERLNTLYPEQRSMVVQAFERYGR